MMTAYRFGDRMLALDEAGNVVDCGPAPAMDIERMRINTQRARVQISAHGVKHSTGARKVAFQAALEREAAKLEALENKSAPAIDKC
jgi:hypothetical protein